MYRLDESTKAKVKNLSEYTLYLEEDLGTTARRFDLQVGRVYDALRREGQLTDLEARGIMYNLVIAGRKTMEEVFGEFKE